MQCCLSTGVPGEKAKKPRLSHVRERRGFSVLFKGPKLFHEEATTTPSITSMLTTTSSPSPELAGSDELLLFP